MQKGGKKGSNKKGSSKKGRQKGKYYIFGQFKQISWSPSVSCQQERGEERGWTCDRACMDGGGRRDSHNRGYNYGWERKTYHHGAIGRCNAGICPGSTKLC